MQQGIDQVVRKVEGCGSRMPALVAHDAEAPPQRRREGSAARIHPGVFDGIREPPARFNWPVEDPMDQRGIAHAHLQLNNF